MSKLPKKVRRGHQLTPIGPELRKVSSAAGETGIRTDLRYGNGTETLFKSLQSKIALFLSLFPKRVLSPIEAGTERTGISSKIRTSFAAQNTLRSSTP